MPRPGSPRRPTGFSYRAATPALAAAVEALERIYSERPVSVIDTIYSATPSAVTRFADAFRLKGD